MMGGKEELKQASETEGNQSCAKVFCIDLECLLIITVSVLGKSSVAIWLIMNASRQQDGKKFQEVCAVVPHRLQRRNM